LFNSIKETVDKKDELTKEINKVNAEITNISKEISKFTICPLCGGSLGDHTHE
jgi:peptidoglycan hydrolase CwlO-like protein